MKPLKKIRLRQGISQRHLARRAGVAYKTLQLLESRSHDSRLSTLEQIAGALGYPEGSLRRQVNDFWNSPPDSVKRISEAILEAGEASWKIHLFNFVDAFRAHSDSTDYIAGAPNETSSPKVKALLAATVETLCDDFGRSAPPWCAGIPPLDRPWFPSGIENLKAMALVESPVHFRKRNIFVLENFLSRA